MRISDWSSDVCSSDLAHARHEARRPHIGVLVEALADGQPQLPEGDVIANVRIAHRAEVNGIEAAPDIDAVLRHHTAGPAIAVGAPVEALRLHGKTAVTTGRAPCRKRVRTAG